MADNTDNSFYSGFKKYALVALVTLGGFAGNVFGQRAYSDQTADQRGNAVKITLNLDGKEIGAKEAIAPLTKAADEAAPKKDRKASIGPGERAFRTLMSDIFVGGGDAAFSAQDKEEIKKSVDKLNTVTRNILNTKVEVSNQGAEVQLGGHKLSLSMQDIYGMSGDNYKLGGVTETGLNLNGVNFANLKHLVANMELANAHVNQETGQLTPIPQSKAAAEIVGLLDKDGATAATLKKAQEISQKAGIAFKQNGKTITLECGGFGTLQLNTQVGR